MTIGKISPLQLHSPELSAQYYEEPKLLFAEDGAHCHPKIGIALYGPRSLGTSRHKQEVHVGFIGSAEGMDAARHFYSDLADGVDSENDQIAFPGCRADRGFRCELRMDENICESITRREILEVSGIRSQRERFERFLEILEDKLELLTQRD